MQRQLRVASSPCDLASIGLIAQQRLTEQGRHQVVQKEQQLRAESGDSRNVIGRSSLSRHISPSAADNEEVAN
jgi:hypothetical protein